MKKNTNNSCSSAADSKKHDKMRKSSENSARNHFAKACQNLIEIKDRTEDFPKFDFNEIAKGKVLGKGGFGTVYECLQFTVADEHKNSNSPGPGANGTAAAAAAAAAANDDYESRAFIAEHCIREDGNARYALKILSPEVANDSSLYFQGLVDLAMEARILCDIEHPNIVKMRALPNGAHSSSADTEPCSRNYFIIMDRLFDTLGTRITKWSKRDKALRGGMAKMFGDRKGIKADALYLERVHAAFDLAAALQYLHNRNIVYRDLKPENIGFDIRNDIKLFDFGLSKELHEDQRAKNEDACKSNIACYKLTEMTGSPKYMAPEVALGNPYNETCDSYSFCILLWEMLSLRQAFELYGMSRMKQNVWNDEVQKRPPMVSNQKPLIERKPMQQLLQNGWCHDYRQRRSMESITKLLRKECIFFRLNGDDSGLEHFRRRSTFVFRKPPPMRVRAS